MELIVKPVTSMNLKRLGFKEPTWKHYEDSDFSRVISNITIQNWNLDSNKYSAPTLASADKWLRDKYNCFIFIFSEDKGKSYGWEIDESHKDFYKTLPEDDEIELTRYNFKSHELAFEDALQYASNLIYDTNKTT